MLDPTDIKKTLEQAGYLEADLEWLPDRIFDAICKEPDELNDNDLVYLIQYRKARNGYDGVDD
jgi:hypothetical protein